MKELEVAAIETQKRIKEKKQENIEIEMYFEGYKKAIKDSVNILDLNRGIWADLISMPKILDLIKDE